MINADEATRLIENQHLPIVKSFKPLGLSVNSILAEPVLADRNLPPFNRVTMDGIALRKEQILKGQRSFVSEGYQAAGRPALQCSNPANCIEVATGAPLPLGLDWVIRYEDLDRNDSTFQVKENFLDQSFIHTVGSDAKASDVLIKPGTKIGPAETAILASVGKSEVLVATPPTVALFYGGDELVAIEESPLPWQIRASNHIALQSALLQAGIEAPAFHLLDNPERITEIIKPLLNSYEVLILTGGVSKGALDYIPSVLQSLGVEKIFHGVAQRPGKPLWFGRTESTLVFALPGNPVSAFFCFIQYVIPWLKQHAGETRKTGTAQLSAEVKGLESLTWFLPVKVTLEGGILCAQPFPGNGSGDYVSLAQTDGFLRIPPGKITHPPGASFEFIGTRLIW